MKILHTADIHLVKDNEKRLAVLNYLLQKANELKVEYFIIAGDLFESDADATILRSTIKKIFDTASNKFLIIPGNHDVNSFNAHYDYGANVIQMTERPFGIIELDDLIVCGIPYHNNKFSECIKNIPESCDILICHGTLYDKSFIIQLLDEEEIEYMPIFPQNLENIARYIALGHIHSKSFYKEYKNTKVVYPGSPITLNTKCTEPRCFFYIEIDKTKIKIEKKEITISQYWQTKNFFVFPGVEEKILQEIEIYLKNINKENIMPNIIIQGFIEIGDKNFSDKIFTLKENYRKGFSGFNLNTDRIQSWDRIIQNQMVRRFVDKTDGLSNEVRMKIFEMIFPIFSKIIK